MFCDTKKNWFEGERRASARNVVVLLGITVFDNDGRQHTQWNSIVPHCNGISTASSARRCRALVPVDSRSPLLCTDAIHENVRSAVELLVEWSRCGQPTSMPPSRHTISRIVKFNEPTTTTSTATTTAYNIYNDNNNVGKSNKIAAFVCANGWMDIYAGRTKIWDARWLYAFSTYAHAFRYNFLFVLLCVVAPPSRLSITNSLARVLNNWGNHFDSAVHQKVFD